jgi:hypothetical protein
MCPLQCFTPMSRRLNKTMAVDHCIVSITWLNYYLLKKNNFVPKACDNTTKLEGPFEVLDIITEVIDTIIE